MNCGRNRLPHYADFAVLVSGAPAFAEPKMAFTLQDLSRAQESRRLLEAQIRDVRSLLRSDTPNVHRALPMPASVRSNQVTNG
jgi:hypothetical protein